MILDLLRTAAVADRVVWRDHPGACLCDGAHPHHGDVTGAQLADLVEAGDDRAYDRARAIILQGVALAVRGAI